MGLRARFLLRGRGWAAGAAAGLAMFGVIASAWSAALGESSGATPSITWRFEPVMVNGRNAFHVVETFRARHAETGLSVPAQWGGAAHLEAQTQNLKAEPADATLTGPKDPASPGEWKLHARVGERVVLTYDIVPQQTEWFRHPQEHMAIINTDYFLFNTDNALVYPGMPRTGEVKATFDWSALPKNLPIVTSFGMIRSGDRDRVTRVRAPWIRIVNGLLAGGNFRIAEDRVIGSSVVLAARGIWKFSDVDALAQVRRIVDEENKFWHAAPLPYFLVTLAPFDDKSGDNDGSGFTNAFMLFLSHEDAMDADRIELMAHEMFHHWNPMSMGNVGADEVAQWFSEGFTVYYAGVLPLRIGLISYDDYLEYLNKWLRRYEMSPLRGMTEAAWKGIPHNLGAGYELSYERGATVALWADAAIRAQSGGKASLDNVMFDLVKQNQTQTPPPDFTEERVIGAFEPYLSADEMVQLRKMVIDGADVPLPEKLGSCAERKTGTRAVVDPGFDAQTSMQNKRVSGVVTDGPAWRAGIRNGQELFRWSIYNDDPSKDALLGVIVDGEKKMITFSPTKQMEISEYWTTVHGDAAKACTPF